MSSPLRDTIESEAAKALRLRSRDREKQSRPLTELIAADEYLANQAVNGSRSMGIRIQRTRPPGAT